MQRRRGPSPLRAVMSRGTYRELKLLVRRHRAPHVVVQRARMVLIARSIGSDERTVRKWKNRFRRTPTLAGLEDAPRSGRPSKVPLDVRCALVRLACDRPDDVKTPFREVWT